MFPIRVIFFSISFAVSMISTETMFAEFRRGNRAMMSGILSQSFVSSQMHCLHKCRRDPRCKGMNLGESGDSQLTCQLTSAKIINDDDEHLLEEKEGWDFYEVVDLRDKSSSIIQKKFEIYLSSYAQQESSDALQPIDLAQMVINGKKTSLSKGINIVYLKYDDVNFKSVRRCSDSSEFSGCANFLDKLETGSIIGIVVVDTAVGYVSEAFPPSLNSALKRIGVNQTDIGYRQPFCFINMIERAVDWKQEVLKRNGTEPSICFADVY